MSLLREAEKCIANQKLFAELNAFITPLQSLSTTYADRIRDADARRENGSPKSPLDGRLIAIKDNICTRSMPTTCASRMLEKFSSPFDATVIKALENVGAIIGGKTNLDEFGMGSHSTHSHFGPVKSSFFVGGQGEEAEESLVAGGSSGGSAVAVATDQCHAALGTDTGGSVRLPAAYTGVVGFKPSYGLISRWGVVAYANSLDTVGIIARRTSTVREVFDVLNHHDEQDPTNLSTFTRSRIAQALSQPRFSNRLSSRPLRIGVPLEYNLTEMTPTVREAWLSALRTLERQGHSLHPISLPSTKHALPAYYILAPAEASSNLAKYDGIRYGTRADGPDKKGDNGDSNDYLYSKTRGEGFGDEVRRRILLGSFSLSAEAMDNYFIHAQRIRRLVQSDFNNVFALNNPLGDEDSSEIEFQSPTTATKVDIIIGPTASSLPPTLSSNTEDQDPSSVSGPLHSYVTDVCTVPASLAGLPAISVPFSIVPTTGDVGPTKEGLDKVGIQIIGQYGDDDLVLRAAEVLEQADSSRL